jgi:hypothetical protein
MTYLDLPEEEHEVYALSALAQDAALEIVEGSGYVLLEDHFDPAPVLDVVDRYVRQHVRAGGETTSGGYRPGLVMISKRLQDLMTDPLLLKIGELALGSRPAFGSLGANSVPPGSEGMDLHVDYPYFAMSPDMPSRSFPSLCVQLIWYLVDVDEDSAPTFLVPGSQIRPSMPVGGFTGRKVLARAGTVFVGHGALWHGVAPNTTDKTRHAVLGSYVPFWVHPMLSPTAFKCYTPAMQELLRHDFGQRMGEGYSRTVSASRAPPADGVVPRVTDPAERHEAMENAWAYARREGRELDEVTERKIREQEIDDG